MRSSSRPRGLSPVAGKGALLRALAVLLLVLGWGGGAAAVDGRSACREDEYYPGRERIGVLRSTDHGASWTRLGDACFHAPTINPVDPSPLAVEGGVALYCLDLASLGTSSKVIYRATTTDGIEFTTPTPAFTSSDPMTDPYVLAMPDGYRMYVQGETAVLSAWSSDGLTFTADFGERTRAGGVPGALLLPDTRVRLFIGGAWEGEGGVISLISSDGLAFDGEPGLRLPYADGVMVANPNPIPLHAGGYLMSYNYVPGTGPEDDEIHLATSTDAFNWTGSSTVLALGSMPGVVETADGTLLIYYVDFHWSTCTADPTTLCLDHRFQVKVSWSTSQGGGQSGDGQAVDLSCAGLSSGGAFWFFSADNPEMLVKVVNGCALNGRYWAFASAGTNVGFTMTVTDTTNGQANSYSNPDLTPAPPIQDTDAFATCP